MSKDNFFRSIKASDLLEGAIGAVRIHGTPILLAKVGDQIYGVYNRCPHMGCSLQNGILTGYILMCPCHGWKFDIRNGQYQQIPTVKLQSYCCEVRDGRVYVQIPLKQVNSGF